MFYMIYAQSYSGVFGIDRPSDPGPAPVNPTAMFTSSSVRYGTNDFVCFEYQFNEIYILVYYT